MFETGQWRISGEHVLPSPLPAALVRRGIGQRKARTSASPPSSWAVSRNRTTRQYCIFGQPSLFCYEHPSAEFSQHSACFVVTDSTGQKLAYVYFEDEPGRR
jgi:hypothetical protein